MAEDDTVSPIDAISISKTLMYGNKAKLFCLTCRFLGWAILGYLSCGVGFLWFYPYIVTSFIKFYEDIKNSKCKGNDGKVYLNTGRGIKQFNLKN